MATFMLTQSDLDDLEPLIEYLSDGIAAAEAAGETRVKFVVSLSSETRQRIDRLRKLLTEG